MRNFIWVLCLSLIYWGCSESDSHSRQEENSINNPFSGPNPWPEIRKKRIKAVLPEAMKRAEVDVWALICREDNNDPLAMHVGGENAGGTSFYIFYLDGDEARSMVFSSFGEVTALRELGLHDSISSVSRADNVYQLAADFIAKLEPNAVAINSSRSNKLADGLSYSQYLLLAEAMGEMSDRLVSSEELVYEWLSIKLPEEIEIMREAAELTAQWEIEAYETVIPGETRDADVAAFLKNKIKEYGFEDAWNPDQNPSVNSGVDRGHSHATDKIIMPGDVIQTDFGIKVYGVWVTDIQRFAYVLKEGEEAAPEDIQRYWEVAVRGHRKVFENMKPGVSGYELDKIQREWMSENGSLPVPWSTGHPVGYVAHDVGPSLGGGQAGITPSAMALKPLREGMVFAYDGFYAWEIEGGEKTISVEEMVAVTADGAMYLTKPQEELILIGQ
ncbi:MAG: M24 family metallopeptidase [Cyclobacteriaceae bacterium]|nr:aminopeptidase P family protein [Cyclobacteriaceae bacterium]MCH8517308.1 M24 family metallopeptidase [Cyclobacteriaceae bacterium]